MRSIQPQPFASPHYRVKRGCSKLLHNTVISIRLLTVSHLHRQFNTGRRMI